jgi:TonB family protein
MRLVFLLIAGLAPLLAGDQKPVRLADGVTAPKLLNHVEPEFTEAARSAGVQGTVVFSIVVTPAGLPDRITVISPLGFGLDEQAERTIAQWRFQPGTKDGKPVAVEATVEVNFHFEGLDFDSKTERRRTRFNTALHALKSEKQKVVRSAVDAIRRLSHDKYPPAMLVEGLWLREGLHGAGDPVRGLALLQASARKNYGPALYQIGRLHLEGRELPLDPEKGTRLIHDASALGSREAQFYLGTQNETSHPEDARRYFRLCAALGEATCQYRLARLLLTPADAPERDLVQAFAWLELAAARNLAEARTLLEARRPALTPARQKAVTALRERLSHPE